MELTIGNTLFTNAHNFPDMEALVIEKKTGDIQRIEQGGQSPGECCLVKKLFSP